MRSLILIAITLVAITQAIPITPNGYPSDIARHPLTSDSAVLRSDIWRNLPVRHLARSARKRDDDNTPHDLQEAKDRAKQLYDKAEKKLKDLDFSEGIDDAKEKTRKLLDDAGRKAKEVWEEAEKAFEEAKSRLREKEGKEKEKPKAKTDAFKFGH